VIIFWEGYLNVAPTIVEWTKYIATQGVKVKLYIADQSNSRSDVKNSFDRSMISVENIPVGNLVERFLHSMVNHRIVWRLFSGLAHKVESKLLAISLSRFASALSKDKEIYDVAYCVDATGLYSFRKSGMRTGRTVNISLEILDKDHVRESRVHKEIKEAEREMLSGKVEWVIIQDQFRADALQRSLGFKLNNFSFLPNSVRRDQTETGRSRYFHKLFDFENDQKIILSAGMIADSVCSLELSRAIGMWNTGLPVKTVFHERIEVQGNKAYYDKVRMAGNGRVYMSLKPVPYCDLHTIFTSADIGLAIYSKSHGDNFGIIGSASGKLFQYIKYGVPVIASDLPGLRELVLDNGIGLVVGGPEDVPAAIEKVLANWESYSNNARKAFEDRLNMDIYLEKTYQSIYN
jgi:glycosyltransferase involved in cell wall biosynthesis